MHIFTDKREIFGQYVFIVIDKGWSLYMFFIYIHTFSSTRVKYLVAIYFLYTHIFTDKAEIFGH